MTKIIYIEREIKDHFRTNLICSKVSNPEIVIIDRFSEIFNKRNPKNGRGEIFSSIRKRNGNIR